MMNHNKNISFSRIFASIALLVVLFYIFVVVKPVLWFHEIQPVFLRTSDFFKEYVSFPGGFSDWFGQLFSQLFYYETGGALFLFLLLGAFYALTYALLQQFQKSQFNILWSLLPVLLAVTQTINYQFSYSVLFSIIFLQLILLPLARLKSQIRFLIYYLVSAIAVFYFSGSGFLWVFAISVLIFFLKANDSVKWLNIGYLLLISFLIIWLSDSFLIQNDGQLGYFNLKPENEASQANLIFYVFAFTIPILFACASFWGWLNKKLKSKNKGMILNYSIAIVLVVVGFVSHIATFNPEKRKLVESDYYSFHNNPEMCLDASMSTSNFSLKSNINYNLSIAKTGEFTNRFFDFLQVAGTDALYPEFRLKNDVMLTSVDFYYQLGDIQEAKYWALESLKKAPNNRRLLEKIVKIELITGNYESAQKYLNSLEKAFFTQDFVDKYASYIADNELINSDKELIEKRNSIPGFTKVPETPLIRFQKLVETNPNNKLAFECMMLFYLLDGDLDGFVEHFSEIIYYFNRLIPVYEQAILLYGANNSVSVANEYNISDASISMFKRFADELKKYEGNDREAMNKLYAEFGETYLYYYYFVLPQIIKPSYSSSDITEDE